MGILSFHNKSFPRHYCRAPFPHGIWNQIVAIAYKYNTDISKVFPRTFLDHLKWKLSPRPGGDPKDILLVLASCNVYLHLPGLPFEPCQGLLKLWEMHFWITFQRASVKRSLLCMETIWGWGKKKIHSEHMERSCSLWNECPKEIGGKILSKSFSFSNCHCLVMMGFKFFDS